MVAPDLVELARRIVDAVAPPTLRFGVITGSAARGVSDESSDLDLYLYVDGLDSVPPSPERLALVGASTTFAIPTATGWFAKTEYDSRYVDVEAVDVARVARAVESLSEPSPPAPWAVTIACGLRDAMAITGDDELVGWRGELAYRDEVAAAEVAHRGPRLLSPETLFELTSARGDHVSFAARVSQLVLDVIALLGAANRRFVPLEDPKWLPWHVGQLDERPDDFMQHAERALSSPTADAMSALHLAILEALDIVDANVPDADTTVARYALSLRPRPPR